METEILTGEDIRFLTNDELSHIPPVFTLCYICTNFLHSVTIQPVYNVQFAHIGYPRCI